MTTKTVQRFRILCTAAVFVLMGCGDTTTTNNNPPSNAGNTILTVTGTVREASSLKPLAGAHLVLTRKVDGFSAGVTDATSDGSFSISSVPVGSYEMSVTMAGYANSSFLVSVSSTSTGTPAVKQIGLVLLGGTMDLKVVATDNGIPVAGVPVMAVGSYGFSNCVTYGLLETPANLYTPTIISATTNTSGIAVLQGLSQCNNYQVVAAAFDKDGNGSYDYMTTYMYYNYVPAYNNTTVGIALTTNVSYYSIDPQQVIATNAKMINPVTYNVRNITDAGDFTYFVSGLYHAVGSLQPIRLMFRYPVVLSGPITASYTENLADPDQDGNGAVDIGFPFEMSVPITASLDSTGTILTITPPVGGFPENHQMKVRGSVTTVVNGVSLVVEIRNMTNGLDTVYIAKDDVYPFGPATIITADNYNGNNGTVGTVYLELPEYVSGTVRVLSYVKAGIKTIVNGSSVATSGEMIYTDGKTGGLCAGKCGNGAGVLYRIHTGQTLSDGDLITVAVDVTDIEGNRLSREEQLIVQ